MFRSVVVMTARSTLAVFAFFLIAMVTRHGVRAAEPVAITTVAGSITDGGSKHPIANASITFVNASEKVIAESGSDGTFSVALPTGTYRLTVHAKGFDEATRDVVTVGDLPLSVQITLYVTGDLKTIASVSVKTH